MSKKIIFLFCSHKFIAKIFLNELNLNVPFYIRQSYTHRQNNRSIISPLWGLLVPSPKWTLAQHRWSSMVVWCQNQLAKCPNDTQCSQTVLSSRQTSKPIGKNAQLAPHAHKWSSMADRHQSEPTGKSAQIVVSVYQCSTSDTHQNQLVRMTKQHWHLQMLFNGRQTLEPIGKNAQTSLELIDGKGACVHNGELTWSWSSSAHPKCKVPCHPGKP